MRYFDDSKVMEVGCPAALTITFHWRAETVLEIYN
jgi:hypothetical protein